MKSRLKRHILAIILIPLLLGACMPEPGQIRGLETDQTAVYLGANTYRIIDPLTGITCYTQIGGGIECYLPAELDQ